MCPLKGFHVREAELLEPLSQVTCTPAVPGPVVAEVPTLRGNGAEPTEVMGAQFLPGLGSTRSVPTLGHPLVRGRRVVGVVLACRVGVHRDAANVRGGRARLGRDRPPSTEVAVVQGLLLGKGADVDLDATGGHPGREHPQVGRGGVRTQPMAAVVHRVGLWRIRGGHVGPPCPEIKAHGGDSLGRNSCRSGGWKR